jgi:hypothetical protein
MSEHTLDTFAESRQQIIELAAKGFRHHVLTPEVEGRWRCQKPGTGIYAFRVVFAPRTLCYFGDVGEVILQCSDHDVLPWLRGVCGRSEMDLRYLLSKVRAADKRKHFYAGDALHAAQERCKDDRWPGLFDDLAEQLESEPTNWHAFGELVYNRTGDAEFASAGTGFAHSLIWFSEAMRLFVRLYNETLTETAAVDTASGKG